MASKYDPHEERQEGSRSHGQQPAKEPSHEPWNSRWRRWLREHKCVVAIVIAVAVLVALIALAILLGTQPRVLVDCRVARAEGPAGAAREAPAEDTAAANRSYGFFLADTEIIVTGPKEAVEGVTKAVGGLRQVQYCDVRYRAPRSQEAEASPFSPEALRNLTMGLYRIEDSRTSKEVLEDIRREGLEQQVYADLNYLTGLLGKSACSNPHEPEISPHEPEISPHEPEISPHEPEISGCRPQISAEGPDISPHEPEISPYEPKILPHEPEISGVMCLGQADAAQFWSQWAFEHIGAGPSFQELLAETPFQPDGTGVRVGVFDAASTKKEMAAGATEVTVIEMPNAAGVAESWPLQTVYPGLPLLLPHDPDKAKDVSGHGLFVASLIQAVAPESEIELVQVFNEWGCGDLFTLNKALFEFMARVEDDHGTLRGAVLNLSLGVQKPRPWEIEDALERVEEKVEAAPEGEEGRYREMAQVVIDELTAVQVDGTLESLQAAVLLAHDRGAVVAAAAGNESCPWQKPLSPQLPAAYPAVIGVSASNIQRQRSCFSNWDDVAAPGGDDTRPVCGRDPGVAAEVGPTEVPAETPEAVEAEAAGTPAGRCENALVGVLEVSNQQPVFAYWQGTSFSTPLVSGLAALVLDAGAVDDPLVPRWVHPDDVFGAIRCGATTPDGIIDVPATLFRCQPQPR